MCRSTSGQNSDQRLPTNRPLNAVASRISVCCHVLADAGSHAFCTTLLVIVPA